MRGYLQNTGATQKIRILMPWETTTIFKSRNSIVCHTNQHQTDKSDKNLIAKGFSVN